MCLFNNLLNPALSIEWQVMCTWYFRYTFKNLFSYQTMRLWIVECLCFNLSFHIFLPPESGISIEQCEHVVSELQDSMRRALHLYRRVSDRVTSHTDSGTVAGLYSPQASYTECKCLLPQGVLLTVCSVTQAVCCPLDCTFNLNQKLLISSSWIFQWFAIVLGGNQLSFQSL